FSMNGQPGMPGVKLVSDGIAYATEALTTDLSDISERIKGAINYIEIYPGEHYKLLAAIIKIRKPSIVLEIGTHQGYSALCMKKFMPENGEIHTFDIIPWNKFDDSILTENDFDSKLVQHTDDLTKWDAVQKHKDLIENADIIFLDALKDGKQESLFLENFSRLTFKKKCLFIFDDIRLWNMLDIWYHIDKPKLDLTSFGHWSGTGLVEWT
ncbi:MAG: class I SAM-dependent methyltransferase, partial [Chitinophagaceae bacterium]